MSAQLPSRIAIAWRRAQLIAQRGHAAVVVAGAEIGDFEIALRDEHLLVELERASERRNGLLEEALVK